MTQTTAATPDSSHATTEGAKHRQSVAVIGLGGIGGVMAGLLAAAGRHDVVACARSPIPHLTVEAPEGAVEIALRVLTDPAEARAADWVLLCTKAHQTSGAAPWLARLCRAGTRVAVLQNGIGHRERLAPFAGPARVVPTVVYYNGERLAEGRMRMRHIGQHDLILPDDADGEAFAALLAGTPMRVLLSADFATLAWRKLLLNSVANPLTTLTMRRQAVLRREDMRPLCRAVLEETAAVARADGARFPENEVEAGLAVLLGAPPEAGTSMLFDRLAGRALEVEAITGAVVQAGRRHGLATPLNDMLLALLRAISDGESR